MSTRSTLGCRLPGPSDPTSPEADDCPDVAAALRSSGMVGAETVDLPSGRFRMGSVGFYPEGSPVREIEVDGFAIDRGPATVAQFARLRGETGNVPRDEQPTNPVENSA